MSPFSASQIEKPNKIPSPHGTVLAPPSISHENLGGCGIDTPPWVGYSGVLLGSHRQVCQGCLLDPTQGGVFNWIPPKGVCSSLGLLDLTQGVCSRLGGAPELSWESRGIPPWGIPLMGDSPMGNPPWGNPPWGIPPMGDSPLWGTPPWGFPHPPWGIPPWGFPHGDPRWGIPHGGIPMGNPTWGTRP